MATILPFRQYLRNFKNCLESFNTLLKATDESFRLLYALRLPVHFFNYPFTMNIHYKMTY